MDLSLQEMGYPQAVSVMSGEKALKSIQENKFDLVLMDIKIQGEMDGIEVAKQIHQDYRIPIFF